MLARPLTPQSARVVTSVAVTLTATLCLTHGAIYTAQRHVLTQSRPGIPLALAELLRSLAGLGPLTTLLPGLLWLSVGSLGVLSLMLSTLTAADGKATVIAERVWWWACLITFGLWGGMYVGGALTIAPKVTLAIGTLYLLVGGIIAVLWWACVVARRLQAQIEHRQALVDAHAEL